MDFWTELGRHNWTPNGDTTLLGGITIAFYGVTALLCIIAAFRGRNPTDSAKSADFPDPSLHQVSLEISPEISLERFSPLRLLGFRQNYPLLNRLDPLRYFEKFWLWVGLIFILLALHKHFNWLVGLTNFIRNRAYYYAWYSSRRTFQNQFIMVAIILALLAIAWILWRMRQRAKTKQLAVVGLIILATFVVIRSISLHSVDALLHYRYMGWLQLNRVVELGGIGIVATSAICFLRR